MSAAHRTNAAVLLAAADLIAQPNKWCRAWTAQRLNDPKDPRQGTIPCLASDPRAIEWGGTGAIYRAGHQAGLTDQECWAVQGVAAKHVGVERFSDWAWAHVRTQAEVVEALRGAAQ